MLLAQNVVLHIRALLLGNAFQEQHYLPLSGVAKICLTFLGSLLSLHWKGLLDALKRFKELKNTLSYSLFGEIVLSLPCTWAYTKEVTPQIFVVIWP